MGNISPFPGIISEIEALRLPTRYFGLQVHHLLASVLIKDKEEATGFILVRIPQMRPTRPP